MRYFVIISIFIVTMLGCSTSIDESDLFKKAGIAYLPSSETPFSGKAIGYYDTGEMLYEVKYEDGMVDENTYDFLFKDGESNHSVELNDLDIRTTKLFLLDYQYPYSGYATLKIGVPDLGEVRGLIRGGYPIGKWVDRDIGENPDNFRYNDDSEEIKYVNFHINGTVEEINIYDLIYRRTVNYDESGSPLQYLLNYHDETKQLIQQWSPNGKMETEKFVMGDTAVERVWWNNGKIKYQEVDLGPRNGSGISTSKWNEVGGQVSNEYYLDISDDPQLSRELKKVSKTEWQEIHPINPDSMKFIENDLVD